MPDVQKAIDALDINTLVEIKIEVSLMHIECI